MSALANANLLAVYYGVVNSYTLVALGAVKSYLTCVDSALCVNDTANVALSAGLNVLVDHVCALNDYLTFLGGNSDNLALNALGVTGKYHYCVAGLNIKICHFRDTS